jgi:hypothetical protein
MVLLEDPPSGVTVSDTVAERLPSAADIAVTVSDKDAETVDGAVYNPAEVIVPTVELPPEIPATSHVTAVLLALLTVAVNICVPPALNVTLVAGETLTITGKAAAGQLPLLAVAGAVVVAVLEVTVT